MTMTTVTPTLRELVGSIQPLNRLMAQEIHAKAAYRAARLAPKINAEVTAYYEAVKAIQKKHSTKGGDLSEKGIEEVVGLLDSESELTVRQIHIDQLGQASMSSEDMMALTWLIHDPEEEEEDVHPEVVEVDEPSGDGVPA